MTDPSIPMRVKRGFHRVGIALAVVLGLCTLAIGTMESIDQANFRARKFMVLRCEEEQDKEKESSPGNPWAGLIPPCSNWEDFSADEIAKWQIGFSYTATLAMYFAETVLIASLVGLAAYFSVAGLVAALSWIVRGFMVGG